MIMYESFFGMKHTPFVDAISFASYRKEVDDHV